MNDIEQAQIFLKSLFQEDLNSIKLRQLSVLLKKLYLMQSYTFDKDLISCIENLNTYELVCDEFARLKSILFYSNHVYILIIDGFMKYKRVSEEDWKTLIEF